MAETDATRTFNPGAFSVGDVLECGAAIGTLGTDALSMEEVAHELTDYFYRRFLDPATGKSAFALVRVYKTHRFADLQITLRGFARSLVGGRTLAPTTKCLTLLATSGDRLEWNSRQRSLGHQAIPLLSEQLIAESPMIAQLIHQLGLEVSEVLNPGPDLLVDIHTKNYNVFYVQEALGSSYIPAQDDFVIPMKIRSVIGFGGVLPSLDLFAIVLFSKVSIPPETATLFKSLALTVRGRLLPFAHGEIFAK